MKNTTPADIRKAAETCFSSGLFCAESVVTAIANAHALESEIVRRAATGFCSGMARTSGPCGALTGGVMGIGLVLGRSDPGQSVNEAYARTQALIEQFRERFGACGCTELLGCDLGTAQGQAEFRSRRLHERCLEFTGTAAELAAHLLVQSHG